MRRIDYKISENKYSISYLHNKEIIGHQEPEGIGKHFFDFQKCHNDGKGSPAPSPRTAYGHVW